MEKIKKSRILYIDVLRFFCITIVFIHHFLMDVSVVRRMHDLNNIYIILFDRKNFNIGMCSIVLYFLISGAAMMMISKKYIDENNNFDIAKFYKDRLVRILIPFYIVYVLYFIVRFVTVTFFPSNISGNLFTYTPNIYSIFYTLCGVDEYMNANGIATFSLGIGEWFLGCIIFCYMTFPFIYKIYIKKPKLTFILFTLYFILIQFWLPNWYIKPYTNFFNHIYNFFLGMVLINVNVKKIINKYKMLIIPFSISFCLIMILINNYEIPIYMNIKTTIESVSIFLLFYYMEELFQNANYLIKFISAFTLISFEIFLVHHSVIYEVDRLIFKYQHVDKKLFVILFLDVFLTYLFAKIIFVIKNYFFTKNMQKN